MRLLYVHSIPVPSLAANAVQVAKMCRAFQLCGAEVMLALPRDGMGPRDHYARIAEVYGLNEAAPFRVLPVPMSKLPGRELLFAVMALIRALPWRPDVVFTRSPSIAWVAARFFRLRTVFELHDPVGILSPRALRRLTALMNEKWLHRFVVTTHRLKEDSLRHFPGHGDKFFVAPNGADPLDENNGAPPVGLSGSFKVGYVGQLYKGKGMEIIGELAPLCPWATFHVVGGTREDIAYWKSQPGDRSNIVFHGYVPHAGTRAYIAGMDVVLAPYLREVRGFGGGDRNIADGMSPLKLFEYMAHGKPIVSSDLPAIREVMTNGENGVLLPPEEIGEWAAALLRLRDDPAFRQRIAERARTDFLSKHSRIVRAENILAEIRRD